MPVTARHVLTATTPDDPAYEIQPQHWNSEHALTFNAVGSEISGAFNNGGGVSFGLSANGQITASAPAGGGGLTNINVSAGAASNNLSALTFANSNGVSFGLNGSVVTATVATNYQSQGAYLTTAMLSDASSVFAGVGETTTTQAGTALGLTVNTAGVNIAYPAWLTTAQAPGAYLTTARASNDAIGLNSALTANGVSVTANSSGLSLNFPAFLTTAALSNHSHGNPALNLTNLSGTTASNSAGFTLSLSAAAPGGGGGAAISAGANSQSTGTVNFANSNGITFGLSNNGTMTASHNGLTTARASNDAVGLNTGATNVTWTVNSGGISLNAGGYAGTATAATNATFTLNSGGLSLSVAAPGGGAAQTATMWFPFNEGVNVAGQHGQATWHIVPVPTPPTAAGGEVQIDRVMFPINFTGASNSTGSYTLSMWMGLYTKNASTLSLAYSQSATQAWTHSGNVNASINNGPRLLSMPWTTTIGDGRYYVGVASRSTSGGANASLSQFLLSQMNSNFSGVMGVASNRSNQWPLGYGVMSVSSSGVPASIAFSHIDGTASLGARPPSWFMVNGTA